MKTKTIYLSLMPVELTNPMDIKINYPKGMSKMFIAYKTRKQAEKHGREVVQLTISE